MGVGGFSLRFNELVRVDVLCWIRHTYLSHRYTNSEALWFTWNKNNEWKVPLFITSLTLGMAPTCLPGILTALVVKGKCP